MLHTLVWLQGCTLHWQVSGLWLCGATDPAGSTRIPTNHLNAPTASPRKAASADRNRPLWLAYTALALGQGTSAALLAGFPQTAATWVTGAAAAPGDALALQLLATGLGSGAALALALGEATRLGLGDSDTTERLRLSLAAFGAATAALAVVHRSTLTASFFANALAAGGATAAVPLLHILRSTGGARRAGTAIKGVLEGVSSKLGRLPRHGAVGVLQAALTPVLLAAGGGYLAAASRSESCFEERNITTRTCAAHDACGHQLSAYLHRCIKQQLQSNRTLPAVLGRAATTPLATFAWRAAGGALLTVAPAVTYTLKSKFDRHLNHTVPAKILNVGLAATAAGHLAILGPCQGRRYFFSPKKIGQRPFVTGPLLRDGQGGDWLPAVVGVWAAALVAAAGGLADGVDDDKEA